MINHAHNENIATKALELREKVPVEKNLLVVLRTILKVPKLHKIRDNETRKRVHLVQLVYARQHKYLGDVYRMTMNVF